MNTSRLLAVIAILIIALPSVVLALGTGTPPDTSMPAMEESVPAAAPIGPSVSSISVTDITDTSARIDINSDEMVQGYVEYATDTTYSMSTPLTAEFSASPMFYLENLTPETLYHYRVIIMDTAGNAAITSDNTFMTLTAPPTPSSQPEPEEETAPPVTDTTTPSTATSTPPSTTPTPTATTTSSTATSTPALVATSTPTTVPLPNTALPKPLPPKLQALPAPITLAGGLPVAPFRPLVLHVVVSDGQVAFNWKQHSGVKNGTIKTLIVRKEGSEYVTSRVDGTVVYDNSGTSFTDTNVVNGTEYHYALYSYGQYDRYSPATRIKAEPKANEKALSFADEALSPPLLFSRDLYKGISGDDVKHLQSYLVIHGYYPEALVTGYFGALTRAAVVRYQTLNNIAPMRGYVGALTREVLGQ